LEILKFEAFEMENEGENYLIRGTADRSRAYISGPAIEQSAVEHVWGPIPEEPDRMSRSVGMLSTLPVELELRYTRQDLERLEQEGRARRTDPQRTPNASSLSQLPRAAGGYLDSNRLLKIARHGESVMIRYETTSKEKVEDMLAYSSLYDFRVRIYMRRSCRRNS
jgi:hypothetical protein